MDELIRNPTTAKTGSDPIEAEPRHGSHSSGHEENDVSVPGLAKALGALIAGCIVVWLGLLGMWHYLTTHVEYEPVSPFTGMREMPSGPRLQVTPAPALQQYFDEEAQRLHSYGPTAEGSLVFHIPIEKAIDLVAQKGLPTRSPDGRPQQPPRKQALNGYERNPNEPAAQ